MFELACVRANFAHTCVCVCVMGKWVVHGGAAEGCRCGVRVRLCEKLAVLNNSVACGIMVCGFGALPEFGCPIANV